MRRYSSRRIDLEEADVPTAKRVGIAVVAALTSTATFWVAAQPATAHVPIKTYEGDPGRLGDPTSWRTPEFNRDIGLVSIGAEFAYAAGYDGTGMNIGLVDSGFFAGHVREHGSFGTNYAVGDRYHSVVAQGGQTGRTPGFYDAVFNDTHGTHVSGTVGASRDGLGETQPDGPQANMHGVAFNSNVYLGNTHKTDGVFYGQLPANATSAQTPDNGYIGNVYRAVNAAATANGKSVRIVSSSWGSAPPTETYNTYDGLNAAWRYLSTPDGIADVNGNTVHWLNGAIDVARTGTIIGFSSGNAGVANPSPRGAAPYFMPELEGRWFTTSGIRNDVGRTFNPDGSVLVPGQQRFNQCGVAKWSCATAPSTAVNSTTVVGVDGVPQPRYQAFSGTSMAAPHSAAALALIMERFPYMTNEQALYTMFTTGRQNSTISDAAGNPVPNPAAGRIVQVPDSRNGWHTPSLREAMKGPGQLLGPFDVNTRGHSDAWSNDISDVAIRARQREDADEAVAWEATKTAMGWTNGLPPDASDVDRSDFAIGTRREQARNARVYQGSLTKRGNGTLFLTGNNSWHGTSTVLAGKLSVAGSHASSIDVRGGTLGGNGSVADSIDVADGVLRPGLAPEEAAGISGAPVSPGNVLTVGKNVTIGRNGHFVVTIRGDSDYTSVRAADKLLLAGKLTLDVRGALTPGTVLTIMSGKSIRGHFRAMPEKRVLNAGGYLFRVSYRNNRATLTVMRALPSHRSRP
jgi:autotransporter-associated beta strand protein